MPELSARQIDRFWSKVKIEPNGCWEWQASKATNGYGQYVVKTSDDKLRNLVTSRIAYSIYYAVRQIDLFVCHTCDNRTCVNPLHLFLGTHSDNMQDMNKKGRDNRPKGISHRNSKLAPEDVKYIRDNFTGDYGQIAAFTKKFNVTHGTIISILNGNTWKHT